MSSAFDAIIDAFASQLAAAPAVSARIEKDPESDPLPEGTTEAIHIVLGSAQPMPMGGIAGAPVDWTTEIHVKCFAGAKATSARPAANTLANAAYTRLAAAPDIGLGVGIFIGEPRIEWASEQRDTRLAATTLIYTVTHRTSGGNLN